MAYVYNRNSSTIQRMCKNHPHVAENKLGRNDPCHCGSGVKYKKCCIDAVYKPIACVKSI